MIRAKEIRVIGSDGEQLGVMSPGEGLKLAKEKFLDLVEVAPTTTPPVCRIMDYSKHKYEQEKKEKSARKHQRAGHLKEIRIKVKIEEHDYQVKLHHLRRFLNKKDKAKVTVIFKGRERAHPEFGRRIMDRLINDLSDVGEVEKGPMREGSFFIAIFAPK